MSGKDKKKVYVCEECGADHVKWVGQCESCSAWNTLKEFHESKNSASRKSSSCVIPLRQAKSKLLYSAESMPMVRTSSGFKEVDLVLGSGFVDSSVILLYGEPGSGKSTLLLQILGTLSRKISTLYASAEESEGQIRERAERLGLDKDNRVQLLTTTDLDLVINESQRVDCKFLVVDSIQMLGSANIDSAPGSPSQVKACTTEFVRLAKTRGVTVVLVAHITKDGMMAGPQTIAHCADTVLEFSSAADNRYRMLRSRKNRFGSSEIGILYMGGDGLKDVKNASAIYLQRAEMIGAGSVVMVMWEENRGLLIEVQALVESGQVGPPRRTCIGVDQNRLSMLTALIQRHAHIKVGMNDIFAIAVGGVRISEPGVDLALVFALLSSLLDIPIARDTVVFGELGLGGELRPVANGESRLLEAAKHGFRSAIVPKANVPRKDIPGIKVTGVSSLKEALPLIPGWIERENDGQ